MPRGAKARVALAVAVPFLIMSGGAGRASSDPASPREDCISAFKPGTDYFPDKTDIQYTEKLDVFYHGHYKVLTVQSRADGDGAVPDVMVLVQCGAPALPLAGDLAHATVIEIPARTISANENLSLNRARRLGFTDRIIAMGSDGVYAPELRARLGERRRDGHRRVVSRPPRTSRSCFPGRRMFSSCRPPRWRLRRRSIARAISAFPPFRASRGWSRRPLGRPSGSISLLSS